MHFNAFVPYLARSVPLAYKGSSAQIISSGQLFGSLSREMLHKLLALQSGALSRLAFTDPIPSQV